MRRTLPFLVLALAAQAALAQYPMTRAIEVRIGQERQRIGCIAQDEHGLIWAGGEGGLFRTDGEQVEVMARPGRVVGVAADGAAVVMATDQGLVLRCGGIRCDTLLHEPALKGIGSMVVDDRGAVWLGTDGQGLWRIHDGSIMRWDSRSGLPDDHVNALVAMPRAGIVAATDQGLAFCDTSGITRVVDESDGAPDNLVLALALDEEGRLWAGTDRSGVFRWSAEEGAVRVAQPWPYGAVHRLAAGGGMVWAGTQEQGPVIIDLELSNGTYRPSERWPQVRGMLRGADGAVWWCDGSEAIKRADPAFLVVSEHEGVDLRSITAICTDRQRHIWFATAQDIYQHDAGFSEESRVKRMPVEVDARTPVVSLAAAPDGTVWAATFGAGVIAMRPDGSSRRYLEADGLSNRNVLSARPSADGVVFATLEGITVADGKGLRGLAPEAGFVFDALQANGEWLMATDGKGVRSLAARAPESREVRKGSYFSLLRDSRSRVWAIGPGTGFCRIDAPDGACLGAEQPLFDGDLYALGEAAGRIIAFGSNGLLALHPESGTLTEVTTVFGMDGLTAELNALATDAEGALWFACSKGLVRMRPRDSHFQQALRAVILGLSISGEPVPIDGVVRTPYDRSTIALRFTATHWANPAAVRFQYRLLGYSEAITETRDRQAAFPALRPGRYVFQVRSHTGSASEHAPWEELVIVVEPPWWRLPWVVAGAIILVIAAIMLGVRARERRLRYRERMEQEKVRFQLEALRSQVDPHFLFNSFNALVELIESEPHKAVEHVEQLSAFFRNILQVRDRERITVEEELRLLDNYFALEQRRFGEAIVLRRAVDPDALRKGVVPLTLQLLVENALKHNVVAGGTPFAITVRIGDDAIEVRNPLRPRASAPRSTGFGLESISKRYAALTQRPVAATVSGDEFVVRIPLLEPMP